MAEQSIIPPASAIQKKLEKLSPKQVRSIAEQSGVSLGTLLKIRNGQIKNPGIETVRAIYPFLTTEK